MNAVDRQGFIGGSDIAAIIGESPWKDAYALYLEKRGEIEPPSEETKVQRRGRILEPAIAQLYAAEYGATIDADGGTLSMPGSPHFRAQVDAFEVVDGRPIPVEIKSASEFTRGKWGPSGTDDAPTYYCAQLHWQLMATGAPFGRLVALLGADDLRVYTVAADQHVAAFLLTEAREFWTRVQDGMPPPVDLGHPSAADTLARLFNKPSPTEIVKADDLLRSWRDVMVAAGERIKQYEGVRDGARLHLLAAMRNAAILDFDDGQMFERREVKRKGFTVAETTYIDARLKKAAASKAGMPALTEGVAA